MSADLRRMLILTVVLVTLAAAFKVSRGRPVGPSRAGLPTLQFDTLVVPGLTDVADFAVSKDGLLLLDRRAATVSRVTRAGPVWKVLHTFGGRGDGPGELQRANGLATLGDTVVVSSRGLLHYFDSNGVFVKAVRPQVPCSAATLYPQSLTNAIALAVDCAAWDTIIARLYTYKTTGAVESRAATIRFTMDGRLGSHFYALRPASDFGDRILFGLGNEPCVIVIDDERSERVCGPLQKYSSRPPAKLASLPRNGRAGDWPRHLPYFVDRVLVRAEIIVVRPFKADSVVLERLKNGRPLAVGPLDGFIGCRMGGCLWATHLANGMQLKWLDTKKLDSLLE